MLKRMMTINDDDDDDNDNYDSDSGGSGGGGQHSRVLGDLFALFE